MILLLLDELLLCLLDEYPQTEVEKFKRRVERGEGS